MSMIDISNVINISLVVSPAGLAPYSINNLVCFTKDTPLAALGATYAVYASAADVFADWGTSDTYDAAVAVFSQSPNVISGGGFFIVIPMLTNEVLEQAIVRAEGIVYYGACSHTYTLGITGPTGFTGATGANLEAIRAMGVAESSGKLLFLTTALTSDLTTPGLAFKAEDLSYKHSRVLFHTQAAELEALRWGYAGRAMSTNFSGSNTTSTMNLKTITGVASDTGITQTLLTAAKAVGADCYVNIAGQSCVMSHGANQFFDDVYNLDWIVGALEVAGFNYLRSAGTKIPQTEAGMDGLKGAYRRVLSQAVSNGFIAPGVWTGADTIGNPADFRRNIEDFGFYIYSIPVALQPVADRALREAPVCSIGIKFAGAIHSSDVIVVVNQ